MTVPVREGIPVGEPGQEVLDGPVRVGSERRWRVRLPDGRRAVVSQLLPELARNESLRRRYVHDAERLRDLEAPSLSPVLRVGPAPDPRDPSAAPPWRVRLDPDGETLEAWLAARAPGPVDEVLDLGTRLARAMHEVHRRGAVLRNLLPADVVLAPDGRIWLNDVGLARVDILSTRTATSLLLEGSPYASPEHLRRTSVDPRSDAYTLGVILWRALTGVLPYGDGPALLREETPLPPLGRLRPGVPDGVDALLRQCLSSSVDERPGSLAEVADVLCGEAPVSKEMTTALVRVVCQACGAKLRPGLRLCLECGKAAIQLTESSAEGERFAVELVKAKEDEEFLSRLHELLAAFSDGPPPSLNFLVGDRRWYSKSEQKTRIALPARLVGNLDEASAAELVRRLKAAGFEVRQRKMLEAAPAKKRAVAFIGGGVAASVAAAALMAASVPVGVLLIIGGIGAVVTGAVLRKRSRIAEKLPLVRVRQGPAALPAADELVLRMSRLLGEVREPDVREVVADVALWVQRLVDRRAELVGDSAELDLLTRPVEPLVDLVVREVGALAKLDGELADLDEGALVRALAASEARGEPPFRREPLLAGLDRLRSLEDARCRHLARLLEAASLLRRAVELGLGARDEEALHERNVRLALASLEE